MGVRAPKPPARQITIDELRRYAVLRSLFPPTTLRRALDRLGFVQADPIRAPARAQDLTLRHRVEGYRAGDLERRYASLGVAEDFFVNYGFVTREVQALMHPRGLSGWTPARRRKAASILEYVQGRDEVHPRQVDAHFAHGKVKNYWGGSSNATTHLLDAMHYRGLLRVVRRERGIRIYAAYEHAPALSRAAAERDARIDALVDVVVRKYAPLPARSLSSVVGRLRFAVPQWRRHVAGALARARERLAQARVDGIDWYWPADERLDDGPADDPGHDGSSLDRVRLLAPFDPIVWDRRRFEMFWGWAYRFEAYTPVSQRKLGYYALPLLWRDRVVGWANVSVVDGALRCDVGYVATRPPRERAFAPALAEEIERMRSFLGIDQRRARA